VSTKTKSISLVIAGINGRMGRASVQAISGDTDIKLVAAYGRGGAPYTGKTVAELMGTANKNGSNISVKDSLKNCLNDLKETPDVLLEFTQAGSAVEHTLQAVEKGIRVVIGTSGLTEDHLKQLKQAADTAKVGVLVVPNFSVGAVLMMSFARQASKFYQNAEIVETHKLGKLDAPSGTAMHTAKVIGEAAKSSHKFNECSVKEHELLPGARGSKLETGVRVHSLRLPGILSKQDVFFAGEGELLTLRHESHNTTCFEQGIVLAIKAAAQLNSFVLGLDSIITE
jgi:4-hydroxy-tetrahydrodipicolinate reductase